MTRKSLAAATASVATSVVGVSGSTPAMARAAYESAMPGNSYINGTAVSA